jgi:hypothetical protein
MTGTISLRWFADYEARWIDRLLQQSLATLLTSMTGHWKPLSAPFCTRHLHHAKPFVYRLSGNVAKLTTHGTRSARGGSDCGTVCPEDKMPDSELHPKELPVETDEHDFFIRLAITRGRNFYGNRKHSTHREIAEVLTEYATRSDGVLREVFSLLAKFHLEAVEAVDPNFANATGALSNTDMVSYGPCPSPQCPPFPDGSPAALRTTTSSYGGPPQKECYACIPPN